MLIPKSCSQSRLPQQLLWLSLGAVGLETQQPAPVQMEAALALLSTVLVRRCTGAVRLRTQQPTPVPTEQGLKPPGIVLSCRCIKKKQWAMMTALGLGAVRLGTQQPE